MPIATVDGRSQAGVYLRRVRQDLREQLGGDPTPAEAILVDEAARSALIAKAAGEFILRQADGLARNGALLPIVLQRDALVANLARVLKLLRLKRKAKPVQDLAEYIASRASEKA